MNVRRKFKGCFYSTETEMNKDLLSKIQDGMSDMSKGQRAIGRYILDNYDKAAFMTAVKLGEATHVSESTVVRFAIAMGYEGYPELQDALQELIRNKLTAVQRIEITNDRLRGADILQRVLHSDIDKIKTTLDSISREDFDRAVETVLNAKTIYIIGMRSSASLANFLTFYFRLMFADVRMVQTTSGSEVFEHLLRVGEGDAVIAISFPRYSKRIVNAVNYAKSQNAKVIALTDGPASPLAPCADALLCAKSDMMSFVDSLVAPLSIINAMIVAIAKIKHAELESTFSKLETIWDEYEVYNKDSDGK